LSSEKIYRTTDYARNEYQDMWVAIHKIIEEAVADNETCLARVMSRIYDSYSPINNKNNMILFNLNNPIIRMPETLDTSGIINIIKMVFCKALLKNIDSDTQRIVELGSGYGDNLCNLWLNGGPRAASYYGLEFVKEGGKCSELLAKFEENFKLLPFSFNYYDADFSMLTENQKTVVFTSYSIEQIPTLSTDFFNRLLAIPGLVKCIHFEPIGWQIPNETGNMTQADYLSKSWVEQWDYNRNLYRLLLVLQKQGKIRIDNVVKDFLGSGPNPGTFIVWEKI
jgi:hypothetical protein